MQKFGEKYYVGLDMGTSSVGWAVTDENYRLRRAKGKDMWGAHLFDEASTSAETRSHRTARRRRQREQTRIGMLRELFAEEIAKVDAGFYLRLDESKYFLEDRSDENKQKFALFTGDFTDKDYYKKYPTIFHLRKDMIDNKEDAFDVRLLYLALSSMYKRRGNFLNASLDTDEESVTFSDAWNELVDTAELFDIHFEQTDADLVESALSEKGLSRTAICDKLCRDLGVQKSEKTKKELIALLCGCQRKVVNIYGSDVVDAEHKTLSIGFRESNYEEKSAGVYELIGDEYFALILAAKVVHDLGLLANIMKGREYISLARLDIYEKHKSDLRLLKNVFKRYDSKAYDNMFRVMESGNYSAYVGSVNSERCKMEGVGNGKGKVRRNEGKGRSIDDLYATIKKALAKFPADDSDVIRIKSEIDSEAFLPKQLTSANGVIPNQVYVQEMKKILANAEKHLPFLSQKDESGLSVSEKILSIFSFRIPYYVGPLGQEYVDKKGYNVWAERKEGGKVYPWNFEQKIDTKRSAEKFIERMVRHCTYLNGENCLPKSSLLYEKFMVLNELNNLKVNGEPISVETKQDIYEKLFMNGKKVKISQLEAYFRNNGLVEKEASGFLSGIDVETGFKASLATLGKFRGVFGDEIVKDSVSEMIEKIVFWITVYGDDKKFVREQIDEHYGDVLSDAQIKRIIGFKFADWGNLSREFLEMTETDDVESKSIIQNLWETNHNLMELLSEQYQYKNKVEQQVAISHKALSDWTIDDLDGMYLSNPVKRMVWRTMRILNEITEVSGHEPDRIYVEMPREDGERGRRTVSRKKQLSDLYASIKAEEKAWKSDIDSKEEGYFRSKKIYLYYKQLGRCMYSGERIDLDTLLHDNTAYDIDHIYPRHFIKDDSIENNLVLVKKQINSHKSDTYPLEITIRDKQHDFWKMLLDKHFITKEKYERLIRATEFTEEEKAAFISRQLVETRQGTKAITKILQAAFPNATVVFSKAGEVSDFRKKYDMIKVRSVNDLHHAKDAYLNIVVGNTYYVKFTANPLRFIKDAARNKNDNLYKYNMAKIFEYDVIRGNEQAWITTDSGNLTIQTVKKVMKKNSVLLTRRSHVTHGGLTRKDTVYSAQKAKNNPNAYQPMSSDSRLSDVTKYGGRSDIASMCYCLVRYKVSGKEVLSLEALPIALGNIESISDEQILAYLYQSLSAENAKKVVTDIQIKYRCIRLNSLVKIDGFYYYLGGKTGKQIYLKNGTPLILDYEDALYIKKLEKAMAIDDFDDEKEDDTDKRISPENNMRIYDMFIMKIRNVYRDKKTSILPLLENSREEMKQLGIKEQVSLLLQIVKWCSLDCVPCDTSLFSKGSPGAGKCKVSNKLIDCNEAILISQSCAGFYVTEVNLLSL